MRLFPASSLVICCMVISGAAVAQQTPQRDPQAIAVVTQAIAAMGGTVPTDSVATGAVTLVAGSRTETGTIRILTRSVDQSSEQIQSQYTNRSVIYSRGVANEIEAGTARRLQLELVVTSQSPDFPLGLLAAAVNNLDFAFQYVGLETLGGSAAHHIRFWNTFASNVRLQQIAELSVKDVWIDGTSGLPRKLSYIRRAARGAAPRVPLDVFYSDYRSVSGVLYPFRLAKSLNGTPWATITISSVALNNGLTDADFPIQ